MRRRNDAAEFSPRIYRVNARCGIDSLPRKSRVFTRALGGDAVENFARISRVNTRERAPGEPSAPRHEPIPHAGLGQQAFGRGGVALQLLPQLADVDAQVLRLLDIG